MLKNLALLLFGMAVLLVGLLLLLLLLLLGLGRRAPLDPMVVMMVVLVLDLAMLVVLAVEVGTTEWNSPSSWPSHPDQSVPTPNYETS